MVISLKTYEQVALEDEDGQWELACGALRQKPAMTARHNDSGRRLARRLELQVDENEFAVDRNSSRVRVSAETTYIPDVVVIPRALVERAIVERPTGLEIYAEPLPLVVEVWSPSTGDYDIEVKLRGYQARGDTEIWLLHPYAHTLRAWRRQPDGSYTESLHTEAVIEPLALPGVRIVIAELFE